MRKLLISKKNQTYSVKVGLSKRKLSTVMRFTNILILFYMVAS